MACIVGVSTSTKPLPAMMVRNAVRIFDRPRKVWSDSGLVNRSTYRRRYRCSRSVSPCHFSGGGSKLLPRKVRLVAKTVSSPVLVYPSVPSTPSRSPRSSSSTRLQPSVAHLLLADEDLDSLGPVANLEEDHLPLPSPEHDPPGDAHGGPGLGLLPFRSLRNRQLPDGGDRLVAVEPLSPGVEPQVGDSP